MTRVDIVDALRAELGGLTKVDAAKMVDAIFETIKEALVDGKAVKLAGLGNFVLSDKKSRRGRNPQTGEPITISARRIVTFKAASSLKQSMSKTLTTGVD